MIPFDIPTIVIQAIVSSCNLGLLVGAIITVCRVGKAGDSRMFVAIVPAALALLFSVAQLVLNPALHTPIAIGVMIGSTIVAVPSVWLSVYLGQVLWLMRGVDFWGILPWRVRPGRITAVTLLAVLAMIGYSTALFLLTGPAMNPKLMELAKQSENGPAPHVVLALALISAAIFEEFSIRGCAVPLITHWLKKSRYGFHIAVWSTSLLWTLMHVGTLSPDWVKFAQIFPMGLFLGYWFPRAGIIGTVGMHLIFNITFGPFGQFLIDP